MKFNYKIAFYSVCLFFVLILYSITTFQKEYYEDYQKEIDNLKTINSNILNEIELDKIVIKSYEKTIDSLAQVKKKIITKYIQKTNEIDKANTVELVNEFNSIFSSANIK